MPKNKMIPIASLFLAFVSACTPVASSPGSPVATQSEPLSKPPTTPLTVGTANVQAPSGGAGSTVSNQPTLAILPAVTIHLAGDSTVSNYAPGVQEGWGMELGQFFNDKIKVDNQAQGGANIKSFKASANWTRIISALKPGDYVLIQFGANDSGTAHGPVTPADFAAIASQMADEIRAKNATPIFVTPSAFFQWTGAKEDNARLAPYAAAMYTAGKAKDVLVDDLNARGVEWLNQVGQAEATPFYLKNSAGVPDKAHFQKPGATKMAQFVAEELRRIKSPLAEYLK